MNSQYPLKAGKSHIRKKETFKMISKESDSPHHLPPDTVSSKTREGLLAMLPRQLPPPPFGGVDDEEQGAARGGETSEADHHDKTPEPSSFDFCPSPYTVIIGKGKGPKQNLGNKRLRVLASNFLTQYSEAGEKRTKKTRVVNEVIDIIRSAGGCFVKQEKNGHLLQVTESAAREKIGYVFRDLLSDKYRSSSKSKAARRQKEQLGRASFKLERAMKITYPTLLPGMPMPLFSFDTDDDEFRRTTSTTTSSSILPAPPHQPPKTTELCRIVSCEEPEQTCSSTLECLSQDIIPLYDYDADELLSSPLILPDE
jgi:hypothetical protein